MEQPFSRIAMHCDVVRTDANMRLDMCEFSYVTVRVFGSHHHN